MNSLRTYEDWKHCIVDLCQVPLTKSFVTERLAELRDESNDRTRKFVSKWGDNHRKQVVAWFEQAEIELADADHAKQ
ncbi:MAG: hypothetical protein AAGB04_16600 [Pseudomonadota bacterium]